MKTGHIGAVLCALIVAISSPVLANVPKYRANLSPGQLALFAKYPRDYKMNVYQTRRTAGAPKFVYEATYKNALEADLGGNGEAVLNGVTGIPFPIPQNGQEAIWNHKL